MHLNAVDRARPEKLYYQLLEILKRQIETAEWSVGTQIPTEGQLCGRYNVSKATVRQAIAELVSLGYLKKLQGKGTFVRRKKPGHTITMLANFGEESMSCPPPYITRILEKKTLQAGDGIDDYLNLSEEDHCYFVSRLTVADGRPLSLQKLYISYGFISGSVDEKEAEGSSPYAILEVRCGIKIQRIRKLIDISPVTGKDAALLELTPGISVLRAREICYAHGDMPISFSESFYRTDKYPKVLEFERLRA